MLLRIYSLTHSWSLHGAAGASCTTPPWSHQQWSYGPLLAESSVAAQTGRTHTWASLGSRRWRKSNSILGIQRSHRNITRC